MHLVARPRRGGREFPLRFAATKLVEGDEHDPARRCNLQPNEVEADRAHRARRWSDERGLDRAAALADMRYSFIGRVVSQTVVKPRESKEHERSRRILIRS